MEIYGKIIKVFPLRTGVSKNGNNWKSQSYLLETYEAFPKKLCFDLFGDKVDYFQLKEGDNVTVFFEVTSREYNEKWFTTCRAYNVKRDSDSSGNNQRPQPQPTQQQFEPPVTQQVGTNPKEESNFPF